MLSVDFFKLLLDGGYLQPEVDEDRVKLYQKISVLREHIMDCSSSTVNVPMGLTLATAPDESEERTGLLGHTFADTMFD